MTSAERVLNTIHRCPVDRVARNYGGNEGIDARLKQHFGLQANDSLGLTNALDIDFRGVEANYTGPILHQPLPDRPEITGYTGYRPGF